MNDKSGVHWKCMTFWTQPYAKILVKQVLFNIKIKDKWKTLHNLNIYSAQCISWKQNLKKDECVVHIIFFVEPEHNTLGYSWM